MPSNTKQPLTPFKVMTSLLNNTTPTPEEKLTLNSFFMVRWFSNNKHTLPMANIINTFYNMPINIQYTFCEDYIELTKMKLKVKFISFNNKKPNPDFVKIIENIQKKYNVNEIHAEEYYNLMTAKQQTEMKDYYKEGKI